MKRVAHSDREGVAEELRRLPDLDRNSLAERWIALRCGPAASHLPLHDDPGGRL
jgi:hypothetical protein